MEQSSSDNNLNANVSNEQNSQNLNNLETVLEENDAKGILLFFFIFFFFGYGGGGFLYLDPITCNNHIYLC